MAISMRILKRVDEIENEIYNFVQNGVGNNIMEANREDGSNFNAIMHMLNCRLEGQKYVIGENRLIFKVGHLFFEVDMSMDHDGDGFFEIIVRDSLDKFYNLTIDDEEDISGWEDFDDELNMIDDYNDY